MAIKAEVFVLPAHWASYLVNADPSGLEDREVAEVDAWVENNAPGPCINVSDQSNFTWYGDDRQRQWGCERAEFSFLILPEIAHRGPYSETHAN